MTDIHKVQGHWGSEAWKVHVAEYLDNAELPEAPTNEEACLRAMAPLDQFHAGGLKTTEALLELMRLPANRKLAGIDIGSGLGGPARWFAQKLGCTMTGYDLTERFVQTANLLSELLSMDTRCVFHTGNACALPSDTHYDFAIMMAVSCNISDRAALYRSIRSVLKPGGILGVLDIVKWTSPGLITPVPWSVDGKEDTSLLLGQRETIKQTSAAGFTRRSMQDVSFDALQWFEEEKERLDIGTTVGWERALPLWPAMVKAQIQNLKKQYIRFQCMTFQAC